MKVNVELVNPKGEAVRLAVESGPGELALMFNAIEHLLLTAHEHRMAEIQRVHNSSVKLAQLSKFLDTQDKDGLSKFLTAAMESERAAAVAEEPDPDLCSTCSSRESCDACPAGVGTDEEAGNVLKDLLQAALSRSAERVFKPKNARQAETKISLTDANGTEVPLDELPEPLKELIGKLTQASSAPAEIKIMRIDPKDIPSHEQDLGPVSGAGDIAEFLKQMFPNGGNVRPLKTKH